MCTGAAKGQRPIDLPLDLVQCIEYSERAVQIIQGVVLEIRLLVFLGVVALNAKCYGHYKSNYEV